MTTKNSKKITVGFVALGCPKNMVDSERMLALITQAGFVITQNADNADVVVINTCGFIAPAKAEAIEAIRRAVGRKRKGKVRKVIVAGCLPQRLGKELLKETGEIDAVIGLQQRDNIADIIQTTLTADKIITSVTQNPHIPCDDRTRLRITPRHWAYLRISDGCNKKCSFCTIPAIRGKTRSKPKHLVLAEASELVSSGAVELNIIAQDITAYGQDLKTKDTLPKLLIELSKISRLRWIRLLYLYPTGITDRLIETIADCGKIVHYLDIPLQHINPQILRAMRRPHSKDRIYRLIENLRTRLPDCVLRTTLIVGFPGETDARFNELLEFVKWARFDNLGCFTFYPEEGTPAAKFPHQVPDRIKKHRLEQIMLTQQQIAFDKNKKRIGDTLTCLVDSIGKGRTAKGRFFGQAPEIDPLCIIRNCSAKPGTFIQTKITGTKNYDLLCKQIH
ncbi:MAG: 30S ribosomal protein S12 methylthiotransferase RimO [Sedimentisphaerales bacterium]|jgi:ribosomal protein S12 methylthiotransferase